MKHDIEGHSADPLSGVSSTISDLSEVSDVEPKETPDKSLKERYDDIGEKTNPPRPPHSISITSGRASKSRLSLDVKASRLGHDDLWTNRSPSVASFQNYRSSLSASAASIPFFESEAYKQKRNRRVKALKIVRSKFRNIMEKDQQTGSLPSTSINPIVGENRSSVLASLSPIVVEDVGCTLPWFGIEIAHTGAKMLENPDTQQTQDQMEIFNEIIPCVGKKSTSQNELASANKLIGMLAQQIHELKTSRVSNVANNNDSLVSTTSSSYYHITSNLDLQRELIEARHHVAHIQVNRAWEAYGWQQSLSENSQNYECRIDQYEKEVQKWKDRFQEAENDNHLQMELMKNQTKEAQDLMIQAQIDIARLVVKHQVAVEENQKLKELLSETKKEKGAEAASDIYDAMVDLQVPTKSTDCSSTVETPPCEQSVFTTALCRMGREKLRRKHLGLDRRKPEGHDRTKFMPPLRLDEEHRNKQDGPSHRQFTWRKFLTR